jgi:hypothetical protein
LRADTLPPTTSEAGLGEQLPRRHRVADWFYDFWLEAALVLVAGLMTVSGLAYSDEFTNLIGAGKRTKILGMIVFLVCSVSQITLSIMNLKRANRVSILEELLDKAHERQEALADEFSAVIQDIFDLCKSHEGRLKPQAAGGRASRPERAGDRADGTTGLARSAEAMV